MALMFQLDRFLRARQLVVGTHYQPLPTPSKPAHYAPSFIGRMVLGCNLALPIR